MNDARIYTNGNNEITKGIPVVQHWTLYYKDSLVMDTTTQEGFKLIKEIADRINHPNGEFNG